MFERWCEQGKSLSYHVQCSLIAVHSDNLLFTSQAPLPKQFKGLHAGIIFLQDTYSTPEIENEWKYQGNGNLYFAHGSNKSKGVLMFLY